MSTLCRRSRVGKFTIEIVADEPGLGVPFVPELRWIPRKPSKLSEADRRVFDAKFAAEPHALVELLLEHAVAAELVLTPDPREQRRAALTWEPFELH